MRPKVYLKKTKKKNNLIFIVKNVYDFQFSMTGKHVLMLQNITLRFYKFSILICTKRAKIYNNCLVFNKPKSVIQYDNLLFYFLNAVPQI